ncbi:MAG: acyl dehydratase [Caulobacteraceae bacterium]
MTNNPGELTVGAVVSLGAAMVEPEAVASFTTAFCPGWDAIDGAPDAMLYALWSRLDRQAFQAWPGAKRLAVDALRWARNPPCGELLHGRMTVMAVDRVGETKTIVIAQHDLLDESGRLVFSCLTRDVIAA